MYINDLYNIEDLGRIRRKKRIKNILRTIKLKRLKKSKPIRYKKIAKKSITAKPIQAQIYSLPSATSIPQIQSQAMLPKMIAAPQSLTTEAYQHSAIVAPSSQIFQPDELPEFIEPESTEFEEEGQAFPIVPEDSSEQEFYEDAEDGLSFDWGGIMKTASGFLQSGLKTGTDIYQQKLATKAAKEQAKQVRAQQQLMEAQARLQQAQATAKTGQININWQMIIPAIAIPLGILFFLKKKKKR